MISVREFETTEAFTGDDGGKLTAVFALAKSPASSSRRASTSTRSLRLQARCDRCCDTHERLNRSTRFWRHELLFLWEACMIVSAPDRVERGGPSRPC